MMKNKVVVLYHRPPFNETVKDGRVIFEISKSPNGIIPLLTSYFTTAGSGIWVASTALDLGDSGLLHSDVRVDEQGSSIRLRRVPLSQTDVDRFYYRTSKEGFWPVLHSVAEKINFATVDWVHFLAINKRFADAACQEAAPGAIIWVHDYNLWMAPRFIRSQRPDLKVAFFFHTPFPASDFFNIIPWRHEILDSLLASDLICFDIPRYAENFVSAVKSSFDIKILKTGGVNPCFSSRGSALSEPRMTKELRYKEHLVKLEACPEGTNIELINEYLNRPEHFDGLKKLIQDKGDKKMIFAASRADYIKGIPELLQCYERLLLSEPHRAKTLSLILVAVAPHQGMNAYGSLAEEILMIVNRINDRFANLETTPVKLSTEALNAREMITYMSAADIMWIPSLRDGMNIVSKEFVAVKKGDAGVLILSEFAGASVLLDRAVLTNPYVNASMDQALLLALSMPESEQRDRMYDLYQKIKYSDIECWSKQLTCLAPQIVLAQQDLTNV